MTSRKGIVAVTVIVNACIWGFAIIMSSVTLRGTGAYQEIQTILGGSAAASIMVVGGGLLMKQKKSDNGD